ncbi:DUF6950 family protein [Acuticoccus sediminis]|uniref:DUF6950 family protein n=1 Tax=Acuticoccus sediminis TaxID=2184697 RepID=UPI001CFE2F88|nr:hypothetical protein [Acuticoccus sediminis]
MELGERLRGYLATFDDRPFVWGEDDCSDFVGNWVAAMVGRPIDWDAYDSEDEARAKIAAAGGLDRLWAPVARAAGLRQIKLGGDPVSLGDIGIVNTRMSGHMGGIFGHGGYLYVRTPKGLSVLTPSIHPNRRTAVAAWTFA